MNTYFLSLMQKPTKRVKFIQIAFGPKIIEKRKIKLQRTRLFYDTYWIKIPDFDFGWDQEQRLSRKGKMSIWNPHLKDELVIDSEPIEHIHTFFSDKTFKKKNLLMRMNENVWLNIVLLF